MRSKNLITGIFILLLVFFSGTNNIYSQSNDLEIIDIDEALILTLSNNPEIKAFLANIQAKDGLLIQSALFPNSEISVELENFGGSGVAENFDQAETTVLLSQLIPMFGKISKRKSVSLISKNIAVLEYDSKKLDLFSSTKKSFIDVLSNQEKLELIEQLVNIAEKIDITISERVDAGKESPIEEKKSAIEYEQTNLLLTKAKRELSASKKVLAANWGDIYINFSKVGGNLYYKKDIPELQELLKSIVNNPDIKKSIVVQDLNSANITLQRALAVPDPTFGIGYRRLNNTNDNAIVAEFSMPIPFFNRNQGNIKEARYNLERSTQDYQNVNTRTQARVVENYETLKFFLTEIKSLEEKILPRSEEAYSSILEGYREGKFEYLNVLDSQRTLFNSKLQYIDALRNYHRLIFEIERLTGTELSAITSNGVDDE